VPSRREALPLAGFAPAKMAEDRSARNRFAVARRGKKPGAA
jgi:hypothetical protein